ncbi:hypothetical protein ETAA8_07820 [Anatilimnocola aggregata]|uniref:Uncharacterized protein n=1 Tax=Anatilimnocola aggregata TaxID=2528021 RepID=A0A517Y6F7_9BACT|nr:hypothetical protein [Anatilimnocola aggregata]QDU25712.1 hypothetical protein ETAA8_07820 [Anatilimnocola aggregata]
MATVSKDAPPQPPNISAPERSAGKLRSAGLQVSTYDQVAGVLMSVLMIFGFIVGLMFLVWLSNREWPVRPAIPVMVLEDVGGGGSGNGQGTEQEFQEPTAEELVEVTEPKLEQTLDAISLVVTPEVAELSVIDSSSRGNGEGTGTGDGRGPGPGGPGTSDGIPAWERWEVRLNATTTEEYAKQLDFFKIELAVAGGGNPNVTYVTNVSSAKPSVRVGSPKDEKRLRFMHRSGQLRDADRRLAGKAGVDVSGKVVFQFYSPETYTNLLTLENIAKGQRRIIEVRRTVFGVKNVGGRYEFFVISQNYR